jgi:hypothetical protein
VWKIGKWGNGKVFLFTHENDVESLRTVREYLLSEQAVFALLKVPVILSYVCGK